MDVRPPWQVYCLIPDLPTANDILPFLNEIDKCRWYTNFGPLVKQYEAALAAFCQPEAGNSLFAVTFSSATLALTLTLRAMQLRPGANVLLPSLTFPATALAVMDAGLTPILADVARSTWSLDPALAYAYLKKSKVDAVLPVAPFGYPTPVQPWTEFQETTGLPVVVDAAGALGTLGTNGRLPIVYSLHATKPLGIGEGGVLLTADEDLAKRARTLSNFGFGAKGMVVMPGTNAKLSEYQAAVGLAQLARAPEVMARREEVLKRYMALLPGSLFRCGPESTPGQITPPAVFPIFTPGNAANLSDHLARKRIETRRWYYPPLHRHPAFSRFSLPGENGGSDIHVTEELGESLLGIPFHGLLTEDDQGLVVGALTSSGLKDFNLS